MLPRQGSSSNQNRLGSLSCQYHRLDPQSYTRSGFEPWQVLVLPLHGVHSPASSSLRTTSCLRSRPPQRSLAPSRLRRAPDQLHPQCNGSSSSSKPPHDHQSRTRPRRQLRDQQRSAMQSLKSEGSTSDYSPLLHQHQPRRLIRPATSSTTPQQEQPNRQARPSPTRPRCRSPRPSSPSTSSSSPASSLPSSSSEA